MLIRCYAIPEAFCAVAAVAVHTFVVCRLYPFTLVTTRILPLNQGRVE